MTNVTLDMPLNMTSMQDFLVSMNAASGGWFLGVLPFLVFLVVLILFIRYEYQPRDGLVYANVVALLIAILLRAMDGISDIILMVFVAGMVINLILLLKDQ